MTKITKETIQKIDLSKRFVSLQEDLSFSRSSLDNRKIGVFFLREYIGNIFYRKNEGYFFEYQIESTRGYKMQTRKMDLNTIAKIILVSIVQAKIFKGIEFNKENVDYIKNRIESYYKFFK